MGSWWWAMGAGGAGSKCIAEYWNARCPRGCRVSGAGGAGGGQRHHGLPWLPWVANQRGRHWLQRRRKPAARVVLCPGSRASCRGPWQPDERRRGSRCDVEVDRGRPHRRAGAVELDRPCHRVLKVKNGVENVKSAPYRPNLSAGRRRLHPAPTCVRAHAARSSQHGEDRAQQRRTLSGVKRWTTVAACWPKRTW